MLDTRIDGIMSDDLFSGLEVYYYLAYYQKEISWLYWFYHDLKARFSPRTILMATINNMK